ncbi:lactate utilization protein C [Virgibacillus phasianinus]|uniref:Lactate utilization protein C n=1 Tax=Virgibacillus phasianinus TaxID=2017483 RepID=A0A220U2S2_9BACI|nr:lactate utilization protein C [Virgibacillus phasianinus]ASK62458.1 lactate utilization protein C [Virgibacillus phasianinus]
MAKGTIHNKDVFLNEIAGKLGRERRKDVTLPRWQHQPQWEVYKNDSPDDLLAIFRQSSQAKDAHVVETDRANLAETLQKVVDAYGGESIVATNDDRFAAYGLNDVLDTNHTHRWDTALGAENIEKANAANIGIFFGDIGLAESGTIVQFNDKDIARSVSLLPITYIAIVPKSSIVPRMTQAAHEVHKQVEAGKDIATCINFISGPSNSADIEMDIVVGVHGPVKAVYLVVE